MSSLMILILGMHRSGTSSLAGCLQEKGLFSGTILLKNKHNAKGNRENKEVIRLNDSILSYSKGTWDKPPEQIFWNKAHEQHRDVLLMKLQCHENKFYGFKDPRTLLTYWFWREALNDLYVIATFRHPLSVAISLQKRNNIEIEHGIFLWQKYNEILLSIMNTEPIMLVNFDAQSDEYINAINLISEKMGMGNIQHSTLFYEHDLINHSIFSQNYSLPDSVNDTYLKLIEIYKKQVKNSFND